MSPFSSLDHLLLLYPVLTQLHGEFLIWSLSHNFINFHSYFLFGFIWYLTVKLSFLLLINFNGRSSQENLRNISSGSTATTLVGCRWHAAAFRRAQNCQDTCWGLLLILKSCYQVRFHKIKNILDYILGLLSSVCASQSLPKNIFYEKIICFSLCLSIVVFTKVKVKWFWS